jgi:hypothetical protein
MHREEALCVSSRLEPPYGALPLARRLVGIFRTVVQIAMLPVLDTREHLPLGGTIAWQLIRDDDSRHIGQPL